MGCAEGRSADDWVDFDFHGHQIVAHRIEGMAALDAGANAVDGHNVPVPHFGLVLPMEEWHALAKRLRMGGMAFDIAPQFRFAVIRANKRRCSSATPRVTR